jgi:hypothetical protein
MSEKTVLSTPGDALAVGATPGNGLKKDYE